eukprot:821241-Prymnesium_polylepis.1
MLPRRTVRASLVPLRTSRRLSGAPRPLRVFAGAAHTARVPYLVAGALLPRAVRLAHRPVGRAHPPRLLFRGGRRGGMTRPEPAAGGLWTTTPAVDGPYDEPHPAQWVGP